MSYEIVYARQFLKVGDKIIPLVLSGSNNCTQYVNGRERRVRNWGANYFSGANEMIALTKDEIMNKINSYTGGAYQEHFKKDSKWVDDKGLISFYKNGIKDAKTLEELQEIYFGFHYIHGYLSTWTKMDNSVSNSTYIHNTNELIQFLNTCEQYINNRKENESVYICLEYDCEKLETKIHKKKEPKERLSTYYAIKVNDYGYLTNITSRRIKYNYLCSHTKQFKTEKLAQKYLDKLLERGYEKLCNFKIELIHE